jgi:hypothetical protein
LEAAEEVGAGRDTQEGEVLDLLGEVLDLLSSLVDKSLVVAEAFGSGVPRYRLLEIVRQYAAEKLAAGGRRKPSGSVTLCSSWGWPRGPSPS